MKKLLAVFCVSLAFASVASAQVHVDGYYRSNGTYVEPHYRSSPNGTVTDNYSFRGNTNPYTGSVGTNSYSNSPSSLYYNGQQPYEAYGNGGYGNGNSVYGN